MAPSLSVDKNNTEFTLCCYTEEHPVILLYKRALSFGLTSTISGRKESKSKKKKKKLATVEARC